MSDNQKKILAEKLKNKLNSPEYVAVDYGDSYHGRLMFFDFFDEDSAIVDYTEKGDNRIIKKSQLMPEDWKEIINLIEEKNKERSRNWEAKEKEIEKKINTQPNLYYYRGKRGRWNERADSWNDDKGMRGFTMFWGGNGNGLSHHLYVAEEHSVLDNFSFQAGFYLIDNDKRVEKRVGPYEGGFGCAGGETNPNNWEKYIEANDQITITPYEVKDKPVKIPRQNDQPRENENNFLRESENKAIINWLVQYFQKNNIKEISLKSGELVITNNNNEVKNQLQIINDPNLRIIQTWLEKSPKQRINRQDLNIASSPQNSPSQNSKTDYTSYLVGGIIGILIAAIVVTAYCLGKRKNKKVSE